jgi:hypothetical protein
MERHSFGQLVLSLYYGLYTELRIEIPGGLRHKPSPQVNWRIEEQLGKRKVKQAAPGAGVVWWLG